MRCAILTLALVTSATLVACKAEPPAPEPLPPPHDGVTLIQPGAPPYQPVRYRLARGAHTMSQLICDFAVKNDGESGPMPTLVVDLDTAVDEILADGNAKLRLTVVHTSVRDRPGSPVPSDVVVAQATAMQGVVITQTVAPDGQLVDSHLEAAASVPDGAREQLDHLSQSLAQVAMRLPAEPVGVNATWRERRTLPEGGIRAVSETLYTLNSLTATTLTYTSVGLSSGAPQTIVQDGLKIEVTNTRGHSQSQGSIDLARYAFDITSSSSFATAMNVIAPQGTPGAGPSTVEITMAIHVAPTGQPTPTTPTTPTIPANPSAPDGAPPSALITAGAQPASPDTNPSAATDNPHSPTIGAPAPSEPPPIESAQPSASAAANLQGTSAPPTSGQPLASHAAPSPTSRKRPTSPTAAPAASSGANTGAN